LLLSLLILLLLEYCFCVADVAVLLLSLTLSQVPSIPWKEWWPEGDKGRQIVLFFVLFGVAETVADDK
jgi:hypothetical protein